MIKTYRCAETSETLIQCKCERCDHEWIPHDGQIPIRCAKCKTPYWDTPKKKNKK